METYYFCCLLLLLLPFICQLSLADKQQTEHQQDTYGYSDYYPHSYANNTQSRASGRQRRIFDDALAASGWSRKYFQLL